MARNTAFELAAWIAAALLCLFTGYADLHSDDTGIIVGLVALSAFALALLRPVHAWRWGVAMGLAIVAAELYNFHAVAPRSGLKTPPAFGVLMAVVIAIGLVGAYAGVGIRKLLKLVFQHNRPG